MLSVCGRDGASLCVLMPLEYFVRVLAYAKSQKISQLSWLMEVNPLEVGAMCGIRRPHFVRIDNALTMSTLM